MTKKIFPGILGAIVEGIPALIGIVKPLIKKKKINDDELSKKTHEELFNLIKERQSEDDVPFWFGAVKTIVTLITVYFVIKMSIEFGITREDIMSLFGLFK